MVLQTYVTAHPSIAPYPQKKPKYIIPIKKGGRLEFLFNVVTIIDCVPDDIYNYSKVLTEQQYLNLIKYHQHRKDSFGYSRPESPYRFYILDIDSPITQPFERKNIQVSTWINFSSIPKIELINKENSCDDGFATNEEDICNIHEGHLIRLMVNKYERNPIARKKCIEYYGSKCTICDIDFSERYGKLGNGFIHVLHLKPLATIGKEYIVDYKKDLIPVCPNCHAMIHRIKNVENMTIDEMRSLLNERHD